MRQYSIIIFFILTLFALSTYSLIGDFSSAEFNAQNNPVVVSKESGDESYFKIVNYYLIDKNRPFLKLEADELTLSRENSYVVGFNPKGVINRYADDGTEESPILFSAKNLEGNVSVKEVFLRDEVDVISADSNLKSNRASILKAGRILEAFENVRTLTIDQKSKDQIFIDAEYTLFKPKDNFFEYQKNVRGRIERKRKYEENVSFTTDLLTFMSDVGVVEMKGSVTLKKDNLDAQANQGTVFLENYNKNLKYYALSDDVRLQERLILDGRPIIRKAFSEKLEGFISEKKIILTGLPKIFQEKDVIKGNRVIIRENVETVEVDDANTNITLENEKDEGAEATKKENATNQGWK